MKRHDPIGARRHQDPESGQAMVEFGLILFPLLLLVAGIIQFGIALNYWLDEQRLANQGARWAVVNSYPGCPSTAPNSLSCGTGISLQRYIACQPVAGALKPTVTISFPSVVAPAVPKRRSGSGDAHDTVQFPTDHRRRIHGPESEGDDAPRAETRALCGRVVHSEHVPVRRRGQARHVSCSERGQVVVMFALLLPVFLGLGSIVLAIGDWYVHKKHLQTLVDAGAFAGGTAFSACFQAPLGTNGQIKQRALEYSGDPTRDVSTRNRQLEDPSDVHVALNSAQYWAKVNGTDLENVRPRDLATVSI